MTKQANTLRALQAIVGKDHARNDQATLSNYAWNGGVGAMPGPKFTRHWPIAVVMPVSTEEVAAIVRLCVAQGLHYRALSTGNGASALHSSEDCVVIDLARMNRIVKIDPVNQMAIIEPNVTAGRLQTEAMKMGMTCHIVGAGPSHSPLASATSFMGIGITGASTGNNSRNLLALEWVSPKGEIVRIGSTGEDDWFSEEGPGPGFRGLIRGLMGANSALGIFTRIGYKLYPWAGPATLTTTGVHPQLGMELSDNMRFFFPVWPDAEGMRDATFRLNRAGVAFAMLRMPPGHVGWTLTATNAEYARRRESGDLPTVTQMDNRFTWQILTVGHSAAQTAFQEKVVRHVITETGGRFLDLTENETRVLVRNLVTSSYVARVFRGAGSGGTSFGVCESLNLLPKVLAAGEEIMAEERKPGGSFAADGKEGFWAWPTESRQLWAENILASAPHSVTATAAMLKGFLRHFHMVSRNPGLGIPGFVGGPLVDMYGPKLSNANVWMRRIKHLLDPHLAADATMYVSAKQSAISKAWPMVQTFLFTKVGEPILNTLLRAVARKS